MLESRHGNPPLQQPEPPPRGLRAAGSGARDHVPVRAYGLQLRAHRQRPRAGGVRRAGAPAAPPLPAPGLRPQHHRRGRQDQQRRPGTGRADRRDHREVYRGLPRRHAPAGRGATGRGAARHRAHGADHRHDRAADRLRPRLRRRRPCAVLGRQLRRLRHAVAPPAGRDAGRRPGRGRALQARPRRLRAVEALHARPARLGLALGHRPPGLAHRVLGDGRGAPGRDDRYPRRRRRPAVPASRERAGAEHLRARRQGVRALLAAQRHAQLRRQQDVEVAGQRQRAARAAGHAAAGGAALRAAVGALPAAAGLVRRPPSSRASARSTACTAPCATSPISRSRRSRAAARASRRPCATTSTRRQCWPRWPASPPRRGAAIRSQSAGD